MEGKHNTKFLLFLTFLVQGIFFYLLFILLLSASPALAATKTWNGGGSGTWQTGGNWSPSGVPGNADDVIINNAVVTLSSGQTANFNTLTVGTGSATEFILAGNIGTGGSIIITNNGILTQNNIIQQTISGILTVQNGGTIRHTANSTALAAMVYFKAATIDIQSGGTVNLDGRGYTGVGGNGNGPGGGTGGGLLGGGGGGGHSGNGGAGNGGAGGTAYCTTNDITTLGSGGGGNLISLLFGTGGNGGGLINLQSLTTLTLNGTINSRGIVGVNGGGGGAGGAVRLKAQTITRSAGGTAINVSGGNGNSALTANAGGGGGGCVSLTYNISNAITGGSIILSGGTGNVAGGTGSSSISQISNQAPIAPTSTSNVAASSVRYNWTSGGGQETYFNLEQSTDGTNYSAIATTTSATTNYTFTGLSTNTRHWFRVAANGADGGLAPTSSYTTSSPVYTLANIPGIPIVSNPTTSTMQLTIATNSNPANTTYAIYNQTSGTYVAANGSSNGSTPIFFTNASWTGTVTGLSPNTSYQFAVIAQNGDSVNSATSTASTALFTLANPALTPTVSNPTTSTLQLTININGNSAATTYAILNATTGNYVAANGSSNGATPVFFTNASWNGTVTGLNLNTSYQFSVIARNGDGINAATSSLSTAIFTLANPAGTPTVSNSTTSSLQITLNTNSNPANTTYAIFNATNNTYVAANGTSNGATPVFFTSASWTGTATGLSLNTSYQFSVIARNGDNVNATTSSLSTAIFTLATTPAAPTVSNPTTSTLQLTINANGNPANTTYAIYNNTSGNYLAANGTSSITPVFFTNVTWNGTITGLTSNTSYQFAVIARNGDNLNAATSSLSIATSTLGITSNTPGMPTVSNLTTSTLDLVIDTNGNSTSTTYALYNSTSGNYLKSDGTSNGTTPIFFTSSTWNGTVKNLSLNTSYQFAAIAKSVDNVLTATSTLSTAVFTLAAVPGTPTVSNVSTSSLQIAIATNSNLANTTYAIYNLTSNTYIAVDGTSNGMTPAYFTTAMWAGTATGLLPSTSYQFVTIARNGDTVLTATSSASMATTTLSLPIPIPPLPPPNTPGMPIVSNPTTSSLQITLDTNGNSATTTYAIYNQTTGNYLTVLGASSTMPVFFTSSTWNNGIATGLSINTSYQFSVIAKNTEGTLSVTSTLSSAVFTLANTPGTPTVSNPTTSTLQLTIVPNNNPTSTTYAIYNDTSGTYLAADGTSNGMTPAFFTAMMWNGTVKGLTSNTSYQFAVIARNGDNILTATSSLSTATSTLPVTVNSPGTPVVSNPTISTLDVTIDTNGNPASTTYAIYNNTTGNYIAANGSSSMMPVYFTSSSWNGTVTGLSLNMSYQFSMLAKSFDNIISPTSSLSATFFTLANPAGTPTVSNPTFTSLDVALDTNGNPMNTTYAIFNATTMTYIDSNGASNGMIPAYFTAAMWTGTATGLTPSTSYQFSVNARNGDGINATTSSLSTALTTFSLPVGTPTVSHPTTSTIDLMIDTAMDPSTTTYAILNLTTNTYVAADGTSHGMTPVYFTSSSWNGTVQGLSLNTSYQFEVIPDHGTTSTPNAALFTLANPPGIPSVANPTTSTLDMSLDTNGNPLNTTYSLYNQTSATYLAADGTSHGMTPVFFTTAAWNGAVKNLTPNTSYQFTAIARNGNNIRTATSSPSAPLATLPSSVLGGVTPQVPLASAPSTSTLDLTWNTSLDPNMTQYAVYNLSSNTYLTAAGLSNGSTPVYFASSSWNGKVFGLNPNSSYQFQILTFGGSTSTASTPVFTGASVPSGVSANTLSNSQIMISWTGDATNYFVENITQGSNSGWVNGTNFTFSSLSCNSSYSFRVKARNGDSVETGFSSTVSANTSACPVNNGGGGGGGGGSYFPISFPPITDGGATTSTPPTTTSPAVPLPPIVPPTIPQLPPEPSSDSVCSSLIQPSKSFSRNLQIGSTGADVKILQQFLNANGITLTKNGAGAPGKETTLFGTLTKTALQKFQDTYVEKNLGNERGKLGTKTREVINNDICKAPPSPESVKPPTCQPYLTSYIKFGARNNTDQVRKLQTFLHDIEGENLLITGVYDLPSLAAVERFQKKYVTEILVPWGHRMSTGYVYITTSRKINYLYCQSMGF